MKDVYITGAGVFLPNQPVSNDEMEDYLGKINGKKSVVKNRILKTNGIQQRYYALDKNQQTTHTNVQLAAKAIEVALAKSSVPAKSIELICAGTTQGDHLAPGFASMIHAETEIGTCELASFQSVCASGMMALKNAFTQIKSNERNNAVCVGSELASRQFKASRYETQQLRSLPFDTEFLRWMLSDGAGALILQDRKNEKGISLRINWIDLRSHAHEFPLCMYAGQSDNKTGNNMTWLDYPDAGTASLAGAMNLKQDVKLLDQVIKKGITHYFDLIDSGKIVPDQVNWLCCHYSSEYFKDPIKELMRKGGALIPDEHWFSNLTSKGNTGSASIFIMLEELMNSGKLKSGDTILCMVPESGRCITSFMQLTVEGSEHPAKKYPLRKVESPDLHLNPGELSEWIVRQLAGIWINFETNLLKVPAVARIHNGTFSLSDYKLLLHDLRQQVIDGSQWIARAASNIDIELFDLRSAFIKHTATEHKDYQMLEKNFMALGEPLAGIQTGKKNIGSIALSAFMFQQASKPNPVDLLGSMFIIEGIGKRLAAYWGEMIKDQLKLTNEQVSFFTYHGVADENHFHRLEEALNHPEMNMDMAIRIIRTAKTTARLYQMQLEELGNY